MTLNCKRYLPAALAFALLAPMAQAASTSDCDTLSPDVTSYVTPTSYCGVLVGTDGNVSNALSEFNATLFGGFGDWADLGKIDTPATSASNFEITVTTSDSSGPLTGTWKVLSNAMTDAYDTLALVFKAGKDENTDPAAQVGYILAGTSGNWSSPLISDNKNATPKGLSHVSLYGRNTGGDNQEPPTTVPLPAGLPLLLAALGGLGLAARRSKKTG